MAINKVVYGNTTLVDLTSDTVTVSDVVSGITFHLRDGTVGTGTLANGDGMEYGGDLPNLRGTTWYFNDVPSYSTSYEFETPLAMLFKDAANMERRGIYFDNVNTTLKYGTYTGSPTLSKANAYVNGSWNSNARTITFADIDIVYPALYAFVTANATQVNSRGV